MQCCIMSLLLKQNSLIYFKGKFCFKIEGVI